MEKTLHGRGDSVIPMIVRVCADHSQTPLHQTICARVFQIKPKTRVLARPGMILNLLSAETRNSSCTTNEPSTTILRCLPEKAYSPLHNLALQTLPSMNDSNYSKILVEYLLGDSECQTVPTFFAIPTTQLRAFRGDYSSTEAQ